MIENLASGSDVLSLQARDADSLTGSMAFDLVSGEPSACTRWFRFREGETNPPTSGQLEIATPPDYDVLTGTADRCQLTVKVSDGKHADHTATVSYAIINNSIIFTLFI